MVHPVAPLKSLQTSVKMDVNDRTSDLKVKAKVADGAESQHQVADCSLAGFQGRLTLNNSVSCSESMVI